MSHRDTRTLSAQAQEAIRIKAVRIVDSGRTHVEVAAMLGVTRQSVDRWVKVYEAGGEKALKARKRGRRKGKALLPWQCAQTARVVIDRHPDQLKLPFFLWTREAVSQLIEKKSGIHLSVWTVGRYLKAWGFTPQKPLRRAYEQNPEAVARWIGEEYPQIEKQAKREKATILWGNAMGLRSDTSMGRSYGRRGKTPVVPATGQRFGCNMISAISNRGQLRFMVFQQRFTANVFIEFLKRLVKQERRKTFLIVDGHPAHKARKVQKWLAEHTESIRLLFLPPHSPELNPDEMLNNDVKTNAVNCSM